MGGVHTEAVVWLAGSFNSMNFRPFHSAETIDPGQRASLPSLPDVMGTAGTRKASGWMGIAVPPTSTANAARLSNRGT